MRARWRCCLCPAKGASHDGVWALAEFYRHYRDKHMERE